MEVSSSRKIIHATNDIFKNYPTFIFFFFSIINFNTSSATIWNWSTAAETSSGSVGINFIRWSNNSIASRCLPASASKKNVYNSRRRHKVWYKKLALVESIPYLRANHSAHLTDWIACSVDGLEIYFESWVEASWIASSGR